MADYGVNATTLTPPQGAGANVVAPVSSGLDLSGVANVVNIFAAGLRKDTKNDAEERKRMVVQNFVEDENKITNAVLTGDMKPEEAAARSKANYRKYAGGYGDLTEALDQARKNLIGNTEAGDIQEKIIQEKEIRKNDIKQASDRGFLFTPNMSPDAQNAQINAAKAGIQAENTLKDLYASNAEKRAQGTFDQQVAEREAKDTTVTLLGTVAGTNLESFQKFSSDLGDQVRSGKMTPELAQANLSRQYATIEATIVAASRLHPELANGWRSVFSNMNEVGKKLIDPKAGAEDTKSQLDNIIAKAKILAVTKSPEVLKAVVANQFFPQNPSVVLRASDAANQIYSLLSNIPVAQSGYVPQAVGNPEVESQVLDLAKASLKDLAGGKIKKESVVEAQAGNTVSQILKQTGRLIDQGVTPDQMTGPMSFIASAEYGNYAKTGQVDAQANDSAKKVLQVYNRAVLKSVQARLNETVFAGSSALKYATKTGSQKEAAGQKVGDFVDVSFAGSGVVFTAKKSDKFTPLEQANLNDAVDSLKTSQTAVNQIIHAGAHLDQSTDYRKVWEDSKHLIFPDRFKLEPRKTKAPTGGDPPAGAGILSPEEQAKSDAFEKSPGNLRELQAEIDKTKNPEIRRILQEVMDRLKGQR